MGQIDEGMAVEAGKPRAEAQRRGGLFELAMGVGWGIAPIQTFWGND